MLKKSEITHGALFAIPLWHNLGFLYGKLLICSHLKNKDCHPKEKFIRVYDFHTENLVKNFEQDFFKDKELFVDPFILSGLPSLRGVYSWTYLRHEPDYEEDEVISHYWEPGMLGELNIPDDKIFLPHQSHSKRTLM